MLKCSLIKNVSRITAIVLVLCMSFCLISNQPAYGYTGGELREESVINQVTSGSLDDSDYVSITTSGSKINVTFKHSQEFDRIVLRLMQNGKIMYNKYYAATPPNGTFQESYDFSTIPNGEYHFRIVVQKNENKENGLTNYPTYVQGIDVSVRFGYPTMYSYNNIKQSNMENSTISSPNYFTAKSLTDMKRQLFAKMGTTATYRTFDPTKESKFYKTVSDKILSKAKVSNGSDYQKMKALFAYVADNFYYDYRVKAVGRIPYDDPYHNLSYLVNKTGNNYNAFDGKVAMHCDGYAGILIALGRAQGIPCRMIYGRKVMPATSNNWQGCPDSYFESNSHTWMQSWVDGRWMNLDPQQGSLNGYGNPGDPTNKTWKKSAIINFAYFDMSDTLLSYSHYARKMVSGNKTTSYMTVDNEISQLRTFLSSNGNGKKLNKGYNSARKSTWGNYAMFETDGYGSLQYISVSNKKLYGTLNVSNFGKLRKITAYNNSLTRFNGSGSQNLRWIYLSKNKLTNVDLTSQELLASGNFTDNPLVSAKFYANSILRTITAEEHGSFGFKYYTSDQYPLGIYPKANIGYKFAGLYNGDSGKRISTSSNGYRFTPTASTYKVTFALNPNSFRYTLKKDKNTATLKPYTQAAQKRLKALGYFKGSTNGSFGPATMAAVKDFQSKNGMKRYGFIGKTTWKLLFSIDARGKYDPDTPDIPETPEVPDTPDTPETPAEPAVPNVSDVPAIVTEEEQ